MRTSFGIGIIALMGLVACSASGTSTDETSPSDPASPGGGAATDSDPTETADPSAAEDPEQPAAAVLADLAISEIAVFQGVKVSIVKDGKAIGTRNAPVVANRTALVRVYVEPDASFRTREVTAELRIVGGAKKTPVLRDTKTIAAASRDEDPKSTFNFEVPAEAMSANATFQVALTGEGAAPVEGASDGRYPKDGSYAELGAEVSGKLKIVVVPVKYDADGSGRIPDVSAAQLERYRKTFLSRYPASAVEITARAPLAWSSTIARNGAGFSQILNAITQLRRSDGAASDVYYYGLLTPAPSMSAFCRGGCVTGLSAVVSNPGTSFLRASVGVGYTGEESASTMAHEVGHAHGREHAPCGGAQGVDPDFPYAGGIIGVWGYDILEKTLISPTRGRDMMGYCPNEWVSDYTFSALFDRISAVSLSKTSKQVGGSSASGAAEGAGTYRMALVDERGALTWTDSIELDQAPQGGFAREATFLAPSGVSVGSRVARFYPYDHLPGGVLVVPSAPASAAPWSSVRVSGFERALAR